MSNHHTTTVYSPLDGLEVKAAIVDEITRELDKHPDLVKNISYPRLKWSWSLTLEPITSEPAQAELKIEGEIEADILEDAKVSMEYLKDAELTSSDNNSGLSVIIAPEVVVMSGSTKLGMTVAPETIRQSLATSETKLAKKSTKLKLL